MYKFVKPQRKPTKAFRTAHSFTMIELLLVVSIIMMLTALLIPALSRAKETGRTVTCSSNQKQCGMAMMMYMQDNAERFPPIEKAWKGWQYHMVVTWGYLSTFNIYLCPSSMFYPTGYPTHPEYRRMGYLSNHNIINYNERLGTGVSYCMQNIKKPLSQTILFGDGWNGWPGTYCILVVEQGSDYNLESCVYYAHFRHSKGGNFSYVDGHVGWVAQKNMPTDKTNIPWARE